MKLKYFAVVFWFSIITNQALALDVGTHRIINERIGSHGTSEFSLHNYLINNLKIEEGTNKEISFGETTQRISYWLRDGGRYEDKPEWTLPYVRSANHFHNPLAPLDNAGFSGIWGAGVLKGESVLAWSQKDAGTQWPGGHYSWHDVRNYYLEALRSSDKATRDENFAETFRGLGQLMHLVQDMSVPEHARDDGHYTTSYEEWVAGTQRGAAVTALALANPVSFAMSALSQPSAFSDASVPIANLFDTQRYDGTNPQVTATPNIGLAEYTNANFVTGDTIFSSFFSKNFPYPSKATSIKVEDRDILDPLNPGSTVARPYYVKIADGETGAGGNGYLLAGQDYFAVYRDMVADPGPENMEIIPPMDDYVFEDCSKLLLPRAVGYSATLLHYFFRGQIDMTADSGNSGQYVIKNESEEAMSGIFRLYYDDTNDMRKLVPSADWYLSIPANGASSQVTFTAPSDAKEPGKYMLVFLGTHGAESGAVAGKEITLQSKDGVIKIRLTGPDGGQIKRDIIFNVWAKRKDTGTLCKIAAISWKYDDAADYWEVTVPSLSDAIEYNATYNRYDTVTPVGGFDLAQGVYLDYLWKAASVGVSPATYTGKGYYGSTYQEEETRNLEQDPISLGLKIGYKPNTQPIPGIEVLTVFPVGNYNNYSIQLVYDAAKKKIRLVDVSELVVGANDEGIYGLSQRGYSGYSSMIIKVTPSALPTTNYSAEFSLNSVRLDKSKIIKSGSIWTQYPGKYRTDQRYLPASKLDLKQNRVLEDVIPYIYTEQTSDVSALYMNQIQVSSIELNSNMKYRINYNGAFYGAYWLNLDVPSDIGLGVEGEGYCWTIWRGDSSYVLWDNVNGECGAYPGYSPLSWVPSGSIAWVDTDMGSYSLFPVSLIQYKNFEFTPGARTHYINSGDSIPSTLTVSSKNKTTDYSLQEQEQRIFKILNGPNILLRD